MFRQTSMKTNLYKACPRCHGDLVVDADVQQNLIIDNRLAYVCLQCGRRTLVETESVAKTPATASRAA
jgi:DNA-directed RNA polymerase subunit RPC12/RpoP